MRVALGLEIEVIVAQPLELTERLIMIDRRQNPADLAKLLALGVAKRAMLDQRVEQLGFANGYELVARAVALAHCTA